MPAALTLALAGGLALGAYTSDVLLLLVVLAVQGLLIFGWHRALDVPGALGGMVLSAATALGADVALLVRDDARPLTPVTGVLGLAMLGALVHQLTRRPERARLTASLTATTMLLVLVALGALYLPAEETRGEAALVALVALAAAAAAGAELRYHDPYVPVPAANGLRSMGARDALRSGPRPDRDGASGHRRRRGRRAGPARARPAGSGGAATLL